MWAYIGKNCGLCRIYSTVHATLADNKTTTISLLFDYLFSISCLLYFDYHGSKLCLFYCYYYINIWFKMLKRKCKNCMSTLHNQNTASISLPLLHLTVANNTFGSTTLNDTSQESG